MKTQIKTFLLAIATIVVFWFNQAVPVMASSTQEYTSISTVGMQIWDPIDLSYEQEYLDLEHWVQLSWRLSPELAYVHWFYIYEYVWEWTWVLTNTFTASWFDARSFTVPWTVANNTLYRYEIKSFLTYSWSTVTSECTIDNVECNTSLDTSVAVPIWEYCSWWTVKIGVSKLPITFLQSWTEWKLTWLINEAWQWKYTTNIYDLWEANKSWNVNASYSSVPTTTVNYVVTWNAADKIDYVVYRSDIYNDSVVINGWVTSNKSKIDVFVRDTYWRPVVDWTAVFVKRLDTNASDALCTTSWWNWKCSWTYTIPTEAFVSWWTFSVQIVSGVATSSQYDFNVTRVASGLTINNESMWIELPEAQLFPGATFQIPVYLSSTAFNTYEIEFNYDSNLFSVDTISWSPKVTPWADLSWIPVAWTIWSNKISFNANNATQASWTKLEIAKIWMTVKSTATPWNTWIFTAYLKALQQSWNSTINSWSWVVKDIAYSWSTSDYQWSITIREKKEGWFIASWWEYQLFNTKSLTNTDVTTPITLTSYYSDWTSSWATASSCTSSNALIADITWNCIIVAKWIWATEFDVTKSVEWSNVVKKIYVNVYNPVSSNPYSFEFDSWLEYINEISDYQKSDVVLKTTFTDWNWDIAVNTTDLADISIESWPFTYSNKQISRNISGNWSWVIVAKKAWTSTELVRANILASTESDTVSVVKLLVLLPKNITTTMTWGTSFVPWLLKKEVGATVTSQLVSEWDTVNSYVYLKLDDWYIQKISNDLVDFYPYYWSWSEVESWSLILSTDSWWVVTAKTEKWMWIVRAELKSNPTKAWTWYTCANLPDPISITVNSPLNLAENMSSPVVTHRWLSITWSISVTANYANWSTRNMTADARTSYSILSWAWKYNLVWNNVVSADNWTGTWFEVLTTVNFWWTVFTWVTVVNIIWVSGLSMVSNEHYSPTLPVVVDSTLSKIEWSNTYQNAYLKVMESYTDWSPSIDITASSDVYYFSSNTWVVTFWDKGLNSFKYLLDARGDWSAEVSVQSWYATQSWTYAYRQTINIDVTSTPVNIVSFTMTRWSPDDYSLAWFKDSTTKNILGYVTFDDDARRYIVWNSIANWNLISWLLNFTSSNTWITTIDQTWLMTLRWNWVSWISIAVAQDYGPTSSWWTKNIAWNLYPFDWDVDLGSLSGLPLNSSSITSSWTLVEIPVRMNIWSRTLSAFTIDIPYFTGALVFSWVTKWVNLTPSFSIWSNWNYDTTVWSWYVVMRLNWYETNPLAAWTLPQVWGWEVAKIQFRSVWDSISWAILGWTITEINAGWVKIAQGTSIVAGNNTFIDWPAPFFASNDVNANALYAGKENKSFLANIFSLISSFFSWSSDEYKANVLDSTYTWSWVMLWDMDHSCDVTTSDSSKIQEYLANIPDSWRWERELRLADAEPNLIWSWWISWLDSLFIKEWSAKNKYFLEWITASRSWSDVTFRAYFVDNSAILTKWIVPVKGQEMTVQMEIAPWAWSWWLGDLYTMTNNWTDNFYEYTLTNAPSSWTIVLLSMSNSPEPSSRVTAANQYSKRVNPVATFTPIASFNDEQTEWYFNTIFGKDLPVWCWVVTNFPITEINIQTTWVDELTFPDGLWTWEVVWTLSWSGDYEPDSPSFSLVSPFGDNSKFTIDWNQLKLSEPVANWQYRIRVRATDQWAKNAPWVNILWYEQQFTLTSSWWLSIMPTVNSFNVQAIDEEEVYTFSWALFLSNYIDWTWWTWLQNIKITSLPSYWSLYTWWTVVYNWRTLSTTWSTIISSTWAEIAYNDIETLQYVPDLDSTQSDSFSWNAFNWNYYAWSDASIWISVNAIPDTPVVWTWETFALAQTLVGIPIERNPVDWSEVAYYRITNITNGRLYKFDGVTEILSWSYITALEWIIWVKFTSTVNSNADWYFDVESSSTTWSVSPQSEKARGIVTVIPVWDVTCWGPDSITFPTMFASSSTSTIAYDLVNWWTWSYFWCEDMRWSQTLWWKMTLGISDLSHLWAQVAPIDATKNIKISKWSSTWILLLSWSVHPLIQTDIDEVDRIFDSLLWDAIWTLKVLSIGTNTNVTGNYWIQPTIKVDVPPYQTIWAYTWSITMTLDKNIVF